jgi:thiol-disulfide isomerase/thioredoxin
MLKVFRNLGLTMLGFMLAVVPPAHAQVLQIRVAEPAPQLGVQNTNDREPARPDEPVADRSSSVLYLTDGDFFTGTLRDCPKKNVVHWQAEGAAEPFEFGVESIRSAYFAAPAERPAPNGEYCIELSDGDIFFGTLTGITKEYVEVNSPQFGPLKIARAEVHRLSPVASARFEYRGPNGLAEWKTENPKQWRDEAGRLITSERRASVQKEIKFPEQARIALEISWSKNPQFTLTFSTSEKPSPLSDGFRLEVWGRKLVLTREVKDDADVAFVAELDPRSDRVQLEALYNHATGEFSVQSLDGRELAKVGLANRDEKPLRFVRLTNTGADLCLEQFSVSHWNGHLPPQVETDKPRIHKNDNTIVYDEVVGYQADTRQFVVKSGETETRIDGTQVACVVLTPGQKNQDSAFRLSLHDGTRFTGILAKVEGEKLYLERRGIDQPLACAVSKLRSLVGLQRANRAPSYTKERAGRWETKGVLSHGWLVQAAPNSDPQSTCMVWKPRWSETTSPLRADVSGRIVYRDLPQQPKINQQEENLRRLRVQRQANARVFWNATNNVLPNNVPSRVPTMPRGAGNLCLLTGDRIPCESIQIDGEGVYLTSTTVASDFVPHRAIKALEFVPRWTAAALAEVKRTRLLTLPRMQKGNPPTHLVVSTAGDFLRCRVVSMNTDKLVVETRLETKTIPRTYVACIIWLHELDGEKSAEPTKNQPPAGLLVQAVQSDGIRMTFVPKECDGVTLAGASEVLGACRVRLNIVDQLIFGSMIKKAAEEAAYGTWKLQDAIEPEFARDDGKPGQPLGVESILIGKPAPDFQLDLLSGERFKLSEQKGKVIVLDFWATWCGQCMQTLPEVQKVAEEFKDKNVKFIAVNMQEDQASIRGALERLKINPTVVLDIDGAAAERYQVSAIPQIVVIDPETNVAEILLGGNNFADQLRAAIQKALAPKKGN